MFTDQKEETSGSHVMNRDKDEECKMALDSAMWRLLCSDNGIILNGRLLALIKEFSVELLRKALKTRLAIKEKQKSEVTVRRVHRI